MHLVAQMSTKYPTLPIESRYLGDAPSMLNLIQSKGGASHLMGCSVKGREPLSRYESKTKDHRE